MGVIWRKSNISAIVSVNNPNKLSAEELVRVKSVDIAFVSNYL